MSRESPIWFTRVVPPQGVAPREQDVNDAYELIRKNELRDEQILADIRECVQAGRTPVVLSRYKDHSQRLYGKLAGAADHVFLMTGDNSRKEHQEILEQLSRIESTESLILVATGALIGEGFDYPRLDTLFMATPVSFRSVVEQYAGRLNRDYEGKDAVIVYDYVDSHIPVFDRMYGKRLKAYRKIGYEVCAGPKGEQEKTQENQSIFDEETYEAVFQKDLLEAEKTVILSSPGLWEQKVRSLLELLKDRQILGVEVTVVTYAPDLQGFGDSGDYSALQEEMRQAGVYLKTVEESCGNFAVIDQEIVWYGTISLLGKTEADENIMRLVSPRTAAELMELTFAKQEGEEGQPVSPS